MRVFKFQSKKEVLVRTNKYLIDWNSAPSKEQQRLQDFLYPLWKNYVILSEFRIPGSLYRFDIINCNKRLIIEYSPVSHHDNFNKFFHRNRAGYLKWIHRDDDKTDWAEKNNFNIISITETDLDKLSIEYIETKFGINII